VILIFYAHYNPFDILPSLATYLSLVTCILPGLISTMSKSWPPFTTYLWNVTPDRELLEDCSRLFLRFGFRCLSVRVHEKDGRQRGICHGEEEARVRSAMGSASEQRREGERGRERERERERGMEREREGETERHTHTVREREKEREREGVDFIAHWGFATLST
jgi:hypothetical protein